MILTCSSEVKIYRFFLFNFPTVLSTSAEVLKVLDTAAISKFALAQALTSDRAEGEYTLRIKWHFS